MATPFLLTNAGRRSVACLLALAADACGGHGPNAPTPTPTPAPPTPVAINQAIRVLTSDGRDLGTVHFPGTGGQLIRLTVPDLRDQGIDTSTVDPTFFVLRDNNIGDHLGSLYSRTVNGQLLLFPSNTSLTLWMMNSTNSANYACAAATPAFLVDRFDKYLYARYTTVQRLTAANNSEADFSVVDGDASSIAAGLELLNRAWNVNGLKYAELRWVDNASGEILGGFGKNKTITASGYHIDNSFVVLPTSSVLTAATVTVEEALEVFLTFDDLCGANSDQLLFERPFVSTDLSPAGKDLVRFGVLMRNLR